MFFGIYIQPEGARYFNPNMFSVLASEIMNCHEEGITPYIGGDFNSRIGNPSTILGDLSWLYYDNIDKTSNKHGRTYFRDLCFTSDVMPINCLKYKNVEIDNDFTFIGGNGCSQIDFVLTDSYGKKNINHFKILKEDWHF